MVVIRNKLNQRLTINLKSGTLELLGKSTAVVSDDDFSSTHLKNLLGSEKIIIESQKEEKPERKWAPKKSKPAEEKIPEPEEKAEVSQEQGETAQPEEPGTEVGTEGSLESGQTESESELPVQERKKSSYIKRKR